MFKSFYAIKKYLGKPINCHKCCAIKNLDYHHKDFNKNNNILSNLMVLCRSCHRKIHWPNSPQSFKLTRKGIPQPKSARIKISIAMLGNHNADNNTNMLGKKFNEHSKRKLSLALKGRKFTAEHKRKISLKLIGNKNGIGNKNRLGKPHSIKTRKAMAKIMRGNTYRADFLKRMNI